MNRLLRGRWDCVRFVPRCSSVGPEHERDEADDADGEAEQDRGHLEEAPETLST
jgi:hypothetical protein